MNHHPLWTATRPYLYVTLSLSLSRARARARTSGGGGHRSRLSALGFQLSTQDSPRSRKRKKNVVKLGHPDDISRRCNATRKRETREQSRRRHPAREKRISIRPIRRLFGVRGPVLVFFRNVTQNITGLYERIIRIYIYLRNHYPMVLVASYRILLYIRRKKRQRQLLTCIALPLISFSRNYYYHVCIIIST